MLNNLFRNYFVQSPTPPQYVFWYHNDRMINYDTERGGVTVSTEPGPSTHSRLVVNQAKLTDSGNYTCRAPNTEQDTIYVFVSKGKLILVLSYIFNVQKKIKK